MAGVPGVNEIGEISISGAAEGVGEESGLVEGEDMTTDTETSERLVEELKDKR